MISVITTAYSLTSPDGKIIAKYVGAEYGMGSPTLGNFVLRTKDGIALCSFPGFAPSSFSDDSRYFIYRKRYGSPSAGLMTSQTTVIEATTGKEVWIVEAQQNMPFAEVCLPGVRLFVNGQHIQSLKDDRQALDESLCGYEYTGL